MNLIELDCNHTFQGFCPFWPCLYIYKIARQFINNKKIEAMKSSTLNKNKIIIHTKYYLIKIKIIFHIKTNFSIVELPSQRPCKRGQFSLPLMPLWPLGKRYSKVRQMLPKRPSFQAAVACLISWRVETHVPHLVGRPILLGPDCPKGIKNPNHSELQK